MCETPCVNDLYFYLGRLSKYDLRYRLAFVFIWPCTQIRLNEPGYVGSIRTFLRNQRVAI